MSPIIQEVTVKLNPESQQRLREDVAQAVSQGIQEGITRAAQSAMEGVVLEAKPGHDGQGKEEGGPEGPEPKPGPTPQETPRRTYEGPEVTKPYSPPVQK
jgi:hypothetical protein